MEEFIKVSYLTTLMGWFVVQYSIVGGMLNVP